MYNIQWVDANTVLNVHYKSTQTWRTIEEKQRQRSRNRGRNGDKCGEQKEKYAAKELISIVTIHLLNLCVYSQVPRLLVYMLMHTEAVGCGSTSIICPLWIYRIKCLNYQQDVFFLNNCTYVSMDKGKYNQHCLWHLFF